MAVRSGPFDNANMGETGWNYVHTAHNGVLDNIMNRLAAAASTSTARGVEVSSGVALHGGFFLENDATETVVSSENTSGSPRIDRLVARVDTSANAVTLTVIEGTPSNNPSPPSITGSDEPLWRWRLESGAGSVSDLRSERAFISGFVTHGARPVEPNTGHIHFEDGRTLQFDGSQWEVLFSDSGWVNVPPTTGHWNQHGSRPLRVRRLGKIVTLQGSWNRGPTFSFSATGSFQQFSSIPAGFHPPVTIQFEMVALNTAVRSMQCQIETDGDLDLDLDGENLPSGSAVHFLATWMVD